MGLFSIFGTSGIKRVAWEPRDETVLVHRFRRENKPIKSGAKLLVKQSQAAILVYNGQVADKFGPGNHTLSQSELKELSALGIADDQSTLGNTEVYFVNTRKITDQKWGTKSPITLADSKFGLFEIRAFGTYVFRIKHKNLFLQEIVGANDRFTEDDIHNQLRSLLVSQFTDSIGESKIPLEALAANNVDLGRLVKGMIGLEFEKHGLELNTFIIENISMPDKVKREIFRLSRENAETRLKASKPAVQVVTQNEVYPQIAGIQKTENSFVLNKLFFVAVDGEREGPFRASDMKEMFNTGKLTSDTLVWTKELKDWTKAGDVAEINHLFEGPPPIPE